MKYPSLSTNKIVSGTTIRPLYTASLDSIYTVENTATSKQHS